MLYLGYRKFKKELIKMITDSNNNKMTANQKAKDMILEALDNSLYWSNNDTTIDAMTEKEQAKVLEQQEKRIASITKYLGFK